MASGRFRVATCQFAETFAPRRNASIICRYMARAKRRGARLVHFHEAALSGYLCAKGAPPLKQYDWPALREATDAVRREAARLKLWVVIGSAHPLTPPRKPTNCLYLIGPDGEVRDRYDKRFCTSGDLKLYTPGDRFVTFTVSGVKCALLICFDLRFPELYRALRRLGVQAIFQSFHNGYMDGPGIHFHIMRQTMQAHAGINYFWMSANNSSGRYSRWPSVFIQPDGLIAGQLRQNRAGLMINTIDTTRKLYDASADFRAQAMRGVRHSGKLAHDQRLTKRTEF